MARAGYSRRSYSVHHGEWTSLNDKTLLREEVNMRFIPRSIKYDRAVNRSRGAICAGELVRSVYLNHAKYSTPE